MKKSILFALAGCGAFFTANTAAAQEAVVVEETTITTVDVECKDNYSTSWRDNWFLQIGAGIQSPFVENYLPNGEEKHHITAMYNVGFGHWFSPYLALRFAANYGAMHWDNNVYCKAKGANLNLDLMWDMLNSIGGPNTKRVFGIVPFVGVGGNFNWDFTGSCNTPDGKTIKHNVWTVPVSAGIQFRFRLCKYVDFFLEGRAMFHGDNYNRYAANEPIDVNLSAIGGLTFNFGGKKFTKYNPCEYLGYINGLNSQINTLRGDLAATAAALAAAEAQLPCPEVKEVPAPEAPEVPMLTAVRFRIGSATISPMEMVNIYNIAEYLKANPDVKLYVDGYADKDTGSNNWNMKLSQRRADNVMKVLTDEYGIDANRLEAKAFGCDEQPYSTNNWNRIVLFRVK